MNWFVTVKSFWNCAGKTQRQIPKRRRASFAAAVQKLAALLAFVFCFPAMADNGTNFPPPVTARDFYNAGTELLAAKKFDEAEQMFHSALAAQDEHVQSAALYNLGHAQFDDGAAALTNAPADNALDERSKIAGLRAGLAMRRADYAAAENNVSKMVAAYLAGRGARRELASAEKAVEQAMETYGETLRKWQKALDDFNSAAELNPADKDAARNAEIIEQHIARLVDRLRRMQNMSAMMGNQHAQLNGMMGQLRNRIPNQDLPPETGQGDEEDGLQPEALRGMKEGASREGKQSEVPLSPEEAARILNGISPEGGRRLPINEQKNGQNREKTGLTW